MRYQELGALRISKIGLGTWQFGSAEWGYGADYATREAVAITRRALDLGINLIDTAEIYAFGRSERIVGQAIAGRRDEVLLATKLFPVAPFPPVVAMRARASARRLGVDTIDLYQVHWPNRVVPLALTMPALRRVQDSGLVTEIGVSNFSLAQWQEAERRLGRRALSNQVSFSLLRRDPERDLVPYARQRERERLVIAYSPLAQGLLAGTYGPDRRPSDLRRANPLFRPENLERMQPLLDTLREVASAHGATPAQIALAWVVRRPNVVAIPGASSVAQLESNAAAADIDLDDDQNAALDQAAAAFRPVWLPIRRLGPIGLSGR
jgi:aryl-alcohol dehydrogenase-like predicted oxidoreductase